MRKGLIRDVKMLFDDARMLVRGSSNPDTWDDEDDRINALEVEVLALVRAGDTFQRAVTQVRRKMKVL